MTTTAMTEKKPETRTPAQQVRDKMLSAATRVQAAVGNAVDARRCLTVAAMAIENNPKLIECGRTKGGIQSIVASVAKMALFDLYCDGITGDAYLVPFNCNVAPRGERPRYEKRVQPIIGYKGLRKLVRRSGECEVVGETVHEGDTFRYNGVFQQPLHERSDSLTRRHDKLVGVYILANFPLTHSVKCFYWTREECIAHRDRYSKNWISAVEWATKDKRDVDAETVMWHENNAAFPSMCLKTLIRWACNRGELPMSIEDRNRGVTKILDAEEPTDVDTIDASDFLNDESNTVNALPGPETPSTGEAEVVKTETTTEQPTQQEAKTAPGPSYPTFGEIAEKMRAMTSVNDVRNYAKAMFAVYEEAGQDENSTLEIDRLAEDRIEAIRLSRGERSNGK